VISREGLSPAYCCELINTALGFLKVVCKRDSYPTTDDSAANNFIQTIYDITLVDIRCAFIDWTQKSRVGLLCKVLGAFTSPLVHKYLPVPDTGEAAFNWNAHDVETLDLPIKKKSEPGQSDLYRDKPLPENLFRFLTMNAERDVLGFLLQLGRSTCAPSTAIEKPAIFDMFVNGFTSAYEEYLLITADKYIRVKSAEERSPGLKPAQTKEFHARHRVTVGRVRDVIEKTLVAAKYLLLQFTGIRYGEAALLRKGCVELLPSGDYIVKGTVSKGRSINSPTGLDCWVACPIVRDAVAVLDELTRFTQCEHLFATSKYSATREVDRSVSVNSMNNMLSTYLYNVDARREYSSSNASTNALYQGVKEPYRITTHRLRHTIALYMSKAGLSVPYISMHLKHVYQAHRRFESVQDVTLNYGGIGRDIFQNAVGIKQANRELVNSIYHPRAPVAGPGAEEFKKNRTFYFAGAFAAGLSEEEVLERLSTRGLPLADVGLGYCKGRREIVEDGEKHLPPCLGQLKCNPNRCKNAIIPQNKVSIWIRVYKEARKRMDDPALAHIRPESIFYMIESEEVLKTLGIDIDNL
jgi:integrase